jgi:vWA-MoxR associated protein C-terminal domain/Trypsin-like peptidase domain
VNSGSQWPDPADGSDEADGVLNQLVTAATVRVQAVASGYPAGEDPAVDSWGSGFFVAPGWVLTCAHVLRRVEGGKPVWKGDGPIGIGHAGTVLRGEVAVALPGAEHAPANGLWPWPDLALIRVENPPPHPCVRLSERIPSGQVPLSFHGMAAVYHDRPHVWSNNSVCLGQVGSSVEREVSIRLSGEVPHGISGGPLANHRRGGVCGVVTATRADSPQQPETGGIATPVSALRLLVGEPCLVDEWNDSGLTQPARYWIGPVGLPPEDVYQQVWRGHDRYHDQQHRASGSELTWTDLRRQLRQNGSAPDLRIHTEMLGLLAELPPTDPGTVLDLVRQITTVPLVRRRMPHVWRDAVELLHGGEAESEVARWIEFCTLAAETTPGVGPQLRERVRQWAAHRSPDLDRRHRPPRQPRRVSEPGRVVLRIDRRMWGEQARYNWSVTGMHGPRQGELLYQNDRGVAEETLLEELRDPVARALQRTDSGSDLAVLELVLPLELFDLAVDEWILRPPGFTGGRTTPESLPLGWRRPVVVRDGLRYTAPGAFPEWNRRWRALHQQVPRGLRIAPAMAADATRVGHHLREAPPGTVPLWCGPVGSGPGFTAMDAGLAAGHPIALWQRRADPADGADPVGQERFLTGLEQLLASTAQVESLPLEIQRLRERSAMDASEECWARRVVLLFDDPEARSPDAIPLVELT